MLRVQLISILLPPFNQGHEYMVGKWLFPLPWKQSVHLKVHFTPSPSQLNHCLHFFLLPLPFFPSLSKVFID